MLWLQTVDYLNTARTICAIVPICSVLQKSPTLFFQQQSWVLSDTELSAHFLNALVVFLGQGPIFSTTCSSTAFTRIIQITVGAPVQAASATFANRRIGVLNTFFGILD